MRCLRVCRERARRGGGGGATGRIRRPDVGSRAKTDVCGSSASLVWSTRQKFKFQRESCGALPPNSPLGRMPSRRPPPSSARHVAPHRAVHRPPRRGTRGEEGAEEGEEREKRRASLFLPRGKRADRMEARDSPHPSVP